jgi:hypothetical protein
MVLMVTNLLLRSLLGDEWADSPRNHVHGPGYKIGRSGLQLYTLPQLACMILPIDSMTEGKYKEASHLNLSSHA